MNLHASTIHKEFVGRAYHAIPTQKGFTELSIACQAIKDLLVAGCISNRLVAGIVCPDRDPTNKFFTGCTAQALRVLIYEQIYPILKTRLRDP